MVNKLKPGNKAPESGQYKVLGPRGGDKNREITAIKNKPLPPGKKGESYILVDKTKHKK